MARIGQVKSASREEGFGRQKGASRNGGNGKGGDWRRIEAYRERQALKAALSDIWSEDPELDESIFSVDPETRARLYAGAGEDLKAPDEDEDFGDPEDEV